MGCTVLRVALGRSLIYEGNETVLGTNPNRTHDQPRPYLETAKTVLDLYSDKGMFLFLLRGAQKKNSLKIDEFPFSNCTRNRTRTAADHSIGVGASLAFYRRQNGLPPENSEKSLKRGSRGPRSKLSCTRLWVPPVALHVSRYTCRS